MNTDNNDKAASYGEPWIHAPAWDILQTSEGKCIIYDAHHMAEPYLSRAIQCVNACAGIADPEKAIQAAREQLASYRKMLCGLGADFDMAVNTSAVDSALAQLNNTK